MVGQLIAGETEVQQDPIDRLKTKLHKYFGQVAEVGLHQPDRQIGQIPGGRLDGRRIAIQGDDRCRGANALGQGTSVSSASKRAVHENAAGLG